VERSARRGNPKVSRESVVPGSIKPVVDMLGATGRLSFQKGDSQPEIYDSILQRETLCSLRT